MKKLFILLFLFSLNCFSQDLPKNQEGKFSFEEVIDVPDKKANDIYNKALEWFAIKYNSSKDVIQLKDSNLNKIIGKGNQSIPYYMRNPIVYHTIIVESKDNKVRIIISDLIYEDSSDKFLLEDFPKSWFGKKKLFNTVSEKTLSIISDFKRYMLDESKSKW